jgi:tripartite-type tricarboxylate transporter receptor subunit TctC
MQMNRLLFVAMTLICFSSHAHAEDYPDRPLRMIVPSTPGGAADIMARIIAERLRTSLHQAVVVENRVGANGNLAAEYVLSAPADGYTLLMGTIGLLAINPHVYEDVKFNPLTDFAPVTRTTTYPNVLVVNNRMPVHSVVELVDYAKKNPGALLYSSSGFGNSFYMGFELLKINAGIKAVHVPYPGTASALTAIIAGDVNVAFTDVMVAAPQIANDMIRAIATSEKTRARMLPDVPTIAESGVPGLTDFDVAGWNGIVVKAGTAPDRIKVLNEHIARALNSPEGADSIRKLGAEAATDSPEDFGTFIKAEDGKWGGLVKNANLKVNN